MKKQRILALALAAATATSMFGGFSASATVAVGSYDEKFNDQLTNTTVTTKTIATISNDIENVWTGTVQEALDEGKDPATLIFLDNYQDQRAKSGSPISYSALETAINNAIDEGIDDLSQDAADPMAKEAIKALNSFFTGVGTNDATLESAVTSATVDNANISGTARGDIIYTFAKDQKAVADLDFDYYDEDDVAGYNLAKFKQAFAGAGQTNSTVYLQFLSSEYNRFFGENGLVSQTSTVEEQYDALLEKALALNEDDYSTDAWIDVQSYIQKAEAKAADGKYKDGIALLKSALTVKGNAPKTADLKTALSGILTSSSIFNSQVATAKGQITDDNLLGGFIDWDTYKGKTLNVGVYAGDDNCQYKKNDYKENEWNDLAGIGTVVVEDSDKFMVGAYRNALYTYAAATKASTKNFVSQTAVDEALALLDEALMALDPTYVSSNWATVKMQEALDAADAIVETDYRTSSKYYKDFVAAKEYVEKLLAADNVKDDTASKAADDLKTAQKNLKNCALPVSSSIKNDLKASVKEAKELLEDKTGKSAAQIIALQDAVKVAEDKDGELDLISEYEAAQKALDAAITGYNHPQGWYQKDGKWYYGKDDKDLTGWIVDNGKDYYLNADGSMAKGWVKSDRGYWYWMSDSGAMVKSSWVYTGNKWYYMQANGIMATGWANINGTWYYLNPNGDMVSNGWYWIGGKCYYFYASGAMAANTTIDGYKVDASGAWVK